VSLLLLPLGLPGQQVRTAVVPHAITVGDVFQVVIQVAPVQAGTIAFPDSLDLPADLEAAGRVRLRQDTVADGPRWIAVYPVTAWRPGSHSLAAARVRLTGGGRTRSAQAVFPAVEVRSVLPADTAGIQPKPASDVIGANRIWWPWLLLAATAVLLLLGLWLWRRRRRAPLSPQLPQPTMSAREAVLQALERARDSGALDVGDHKRFYSDVTSALRAYVAAVEPDAGTDLTTTELRAALRRLGQEQRTAELQRVLHAADLVKFARREPTHSEAMEEWQRARSWVEQYEPGASVARAA
jgi:hypothetical protein